MLGVVRCYFTTQGHMNLHSAKGGEMATATVTEKCDARHGDNQCVKPAGHEGLHYAWGVHIASGLKFPDLVFWGAYTVEI